MTKDTITKYHQLNLQELKEKQMVLEGTVQNPQVTFGNKVRNFLESTIFMGATIGTVLMATSAVVLTMKPDLAKKFDIKDPIMDAKKIRNVSLTAGLIGGGISAAANMVSNHKRLKEEQAADNASKLSYVDRLIAKKEAMAQIEGPTR